MTGLSRQRDRDGYRPQVPLRWGCDPRRKGAAPVTHARVIIRLQGRPRVSGAWQTKQSRALPAASAQVCSEDESDERNIGRR